MTGQLKTSMNGAPLIGLLGIAASVGLIALSLAWGDSVTVILWVMLGAALSVATYLSWRQA